MKNFKRQLIGLIIFLFFSTSILCQNKSYNLYILIDTEANNYKTPIIRAKSDSYSFKEESFIIEKEICIEHYSKVFEIIDGKLIRGIPDRSMERTKHSITLKYNKDEKIKYKKLEDIETSIIKASELKNTKWVSFEQLLKNAEAIYVIEKIDSEDSLKNIELKKVTFSNTKFKL